MAFLGVVHLDASGLGDLLQVDEGHGIVSVHFGWDGSRFLTFKNPF